MANLEGKLTSTTLNECVELVVLFIGTSEITTICFKVLWKGNGTVSDI